MIHARILQLKEQEEGNQTANFGNCDRQYWLVVERDVKPTYSNRDTEARRGQKSFEGRVGQWSWNSNGYGEEGQFFSPEGEAVLSEGHTQSLGLLA